MTPEEFIIFIFLGFGFWVMLIILFGVIPLRYYLIKGVARTRSPYGRSIIVMKGKKARQFIFSRLVFLGGAIYLFISMLLFNRFAWEGALVVFVSLVLGIFATFGAERVPRKKIY